MPKRVQSARGGSSWSTALALCLLAIVIGHLASTARLMTIDLGMNDFGKFYYSASRAFAGGAAMYPSDVVTTGDFRPYGFVNTNPPHVHLLILPLALLSPGWALIIWAIGSLLALVWSVRIIMRELQLTVEPRTALWLLVGLAALACTEATVLTGQLSLFVMLIATLAWRASRNRWEGGAGAWLGVLAAIKPFGLIFLPWLVLQKQWRGCVTFVGTVAAAYLSGLAAFGTDSHTAWLASLRLVDWHAVAMNASLLGILSRSLAENAWFVAIADVPRVITPLWLLLSAAVAAVSFIRATTHHAEAIDRSFSTLTLAALLISPLGWVYYWWLALGPAVALFRRSRSVFLHVALPFLFVPVGLVVAAETGWATVTLGSAYFWGTFLLWLGTVAPTTDRGARVTSRPVNATLVG